MRKASCYFYLVCLNDLFPYIEGERFDEMVDYMKEVAKQPVELSVEERNLLSVAYKNVSS